VKIIKSPVNGQFLFRLNKGVESKIRPNAETALLPGSFNGMAALTASNIQDPVTLLYTQSVKVDGNHG
jgi:hypothetical protein